MTYDCFLYNGEVELLEIRYNLLKDKVDEFIVVESTKTFSGLDKPLYFTKMPKMRQHVIDLTDEDLWDKARGRFAEPWWQMEWYQKESIKKALLNLKDSNKVYVSDLDEIWNPDLKIPKGKIYRLRQKMYAYWLNNRSSEPWVGTFVGPYKLIKNDSINRLDTETPDILDNGGWHFTNMGGADQIKRKLESYGHQEFNNDGIKSDLENKIKENRDFIGRGFTFWRDESDLPQTLLDNRAEYAKLFNDPLVSIIIPMYNYGKYLGETIQSALNQTYKNFEIICVDDCSSDNSIEVASKYPVKIIRHEINKGLAETRNTGIKAAKGEYILPLDSDDWIHKDFLKYTLALNTDIASTGQRQFGDQNNVYIPIPEPTFEDFKRGNQINCCSLYKKKVWETVGGYESHKVFEDWHFWLKATHAGFKVKVVQYPLFFYRIHEGSMLDKIGPEHKEIGKKIIKDLGYE